MPTTELISGRHNPLIDGAHGMHVWGWEVPVYLFIGGIVAGSTMLLALYELTRDERPESPAARVAPFLSMGLLSIGMLALLRDLAYPAHVLRFFMTFEPTSPMSWGSWLIGAAYPVLALLGLGALSDAQRSTLRGWAPALAPWTDRALALADAHRRTIVWTALIGGAGVGIYTGLLLGTMAARPSWNTAVLGPLFLTSGLSTGAAFLLLLPLSRREQATWLRFDAVAIVVELALLAVMVLGFATGDAVSQAAGHSILGGEYTAAFWSVVVVGGLVVPLTLAVLEHRRHLPATRVAPVLVLIGGYALRSILVAAGQATDLTSLAHL